LIFFSQVESWFFVVKEDCRDRSGNRERAFPIQNEESSITVPGFARMKSAILTKIANQPVNGTNPSEDIRT
jgi:hypothetical protein